MNKINPTYEELITRLNEAEYILNTIKHGNDAESKKKSMILDQKKIESQLKKLNQNLRIQIKKQTTEVKKKTRRLRMLANKLIRVERDERNKLSGILHDHIQPLIVGARMQVWDIQRKTDDAGLIKTADRIEEILVETLETLRSLSVELSPSALQNNGLAGGLNWLKNYMADHFDFAVNLSVKNQTEPIKEEISFLLFEATKELLLNAAKHADVDKADVTIQRTDENLITLVVADQGKGFDPESTRESQQDTGTLGLFNIQERLLSIDGRMIIETGIGRGTKATLTAPAGINDTCADKKTKKQNESHRSLAKRIRKNDDMTGILIVDDHKVLREGLKGLLQSEPDFHILGEASSGKEALKMAEELLPDVVLMDINLGDMHGLQVTEQILSDRPQTRIIGLSIHDDQNLINAMHDAGAVDYLTKNADSQTIVNVIRNSMTLK